MAFALEQIILASLHERLHYLKIVVPMLAYTSQML